MNILQLRDLITQLGPMMAAAQARREREGLPAMSGGDLQVMLARTALELSVELSAMQAGSALDSIEAESVRKELVQFGLYLYEYAQRAPNQTRLMNELTYWLSE